MYSFSRGENAYIGYIGDDKPNGYKDNILIEIDVVNNKKNIYRHDGSVWQLQDSISNDKSISEAVEYAEYTKNINASLTDIAKQSKILKNKNTLREYWLELFKNNAEFTTSNCSISQDTTNYKTGTSALSITTTTAGAAGFVTKPVSWDLSSLATLEFECSSPDPSKVQAITFYFNSASGYYNEVKAGLINGWNQFRFDKLDCGSSGSSSWSAITSIKVEITPTSGNNATVVIDSLKKDRFDEPKVIIAFDDGLASAYNIAFPILQAKGYRGCACVNKSTIGTANHVTLAQLKEMYAAGWDILNHSATHSNFTSMSYTDVAKEIQDMRDYLYSNGMTRGNDIIVYPNGWTSIGQQVAKDLGFVAGRDSFYGYNYGVTGNIMQLKSFMSDASLTTSGLNTRLNRLLRAGGTAILFAHDIADTATGALTATAIIQQIVDFCAANGIKVMTMSEWYNDLYQAV